MREVVVLPDGRKVSYMEAGDKKGRAVFYFHGVPSAADEWHMWGTREKLEKQGIRLIAIDRPGVGRSSFQQHRTINDWPKDIADFATALGLERFDVLGYSGGGPYAAACAALIPERLRSVSLVSSVVSFDNKDLLDGIHPENIRFLSLSIHKPLLFRFFYRQMGMLAKLAPKQYLQRALNSFEHADAEAFSNPAVHQVLFSLKGSAKGQQMDTKLIISPWGFDLNKIQIPIFIWHGGKDHNASPAMGRYLEQSIPNSIMHYLPEEGHISLIVNYAEPILQQITEMD